MTRYTWSSSAARNIWSARLQRVGELRRWLELETVLSGLRDWALVQVAATELPNYSALARQRGLDLATLDCRPSEAAHARAPTHQPQLVLLAHPTRLEEFRQAVAAASDELHTVGAGYPSCCQHMADSRSGVAGSRFPPWRVARGALAGHPTSDAHTSSVHWWSNILWASIGLVPVSHVPCSFECDETGALSRARATLMSDLGYGEEQRWLEEFLSSPVEWSTLHGIVQVHGPLLRTCSDAPYTSDRLVIRLRSELRPEGAAVGSRFPV